LDRLLPERQLNLLRAIIARIATIAYIKGLGGQDGRSRNEPEKLDCQARR
jgi:hypothetical protein